MPHKVLVIDDSVSVRIALERILKQRPVEVVAVASGMDGIAAMLEHRPAVVICDFVLPDRDGVTLARFVRNHPLLREIPFFLISGAVDPGMEEQARAAGCDAVLHKPFTPETVLGLLDRHLPAAVPAPFPETAPAPAPDGPPARILVIDDSMSVRVALERLLVQRGYETVAASSAAEGLRRLDEGSFDLLITDLVMPDMDGIEMVRFVRENPALRSLPVIIVSGLGDAEIEEKGRLAGVDDVVRKPFTAASLIPKVQALVARARAATAASAASAAPVFAPAPPPLAPPPDAAVAAARVLRLVRSVTAVVAAVVLDAGTGEVVAEEGLDEARAGDAARQVSSLRQIVSGFGEAFFLGDLRSATIQLEDGSLVLHGAGPFLVLSVLADSSHLGLLNLLVQRKLPRILAGA